MANLLRTAKSGDEWTSNELRAFNIYILTVDEQTFFNTGTDLPPPNVPAPLLDNLEAPNWAVNKPERQFFQYLELAERAGAEESAVEDLAAFLLRTCDFDSEDRLVRQRKEISLFMAGQRVSANVDVCVTNDASFLLLLQADKHGGSTHIPEPRLIAAAIAAFYQNNLTRTVGGLPILQSQVLPGIIMLGSAPIFYRIKVSHALVDALETASYPQEATMVLRYSPRVPNPGNYRSQGMRPLENRLPVFRCFEGFKSLVPR